MVRNQTPITLNVCLFDQSLFTFWSPSLLPCLLSTYWGSNTSSLGFPPTWAPMQPAWALVPCNCPLFLVQTTLSLRSDSDTVQWTSLSCKGPLPMLWPQYCVLPQNNFTYLPEGHPTLLNPTKLLLDRFLQEEKLGEGKSCVFKFKFSIVYCF